VTFTQLRTFALVAELGSLRAAAAALGVSEPAVSAAIAALRTDLGDPLFTRSERGIRLTAGGRALAARARELVGLADRTRREVSSATWPAGLRVLATGGCAEHAAAVLVRAFAQRAPGRDVHVCVGSGEAAASSLVDDVADIALGVRPSPLAGVPLSSVAFLRYQRVLVAAPSHPLAARTRLTLDDLAGSAWLAGPAGLERGTAEDRWAQADGGSRLLVRMDSEAEALAAARAGHGVTLAMTHLVADDLRDEALVRLPVVGTPVVGIWWATILADGRAPAAARALQRFLTTPDATTALLARPPRAERLRPTVRVELWS
jgi:DNA-binding transcriptional LysR family regulator